MSHLNQGLSPLLNCHSTLPLKELKSRILSLNTKNLPTYRIEGVWATSASPFLYKHLSLHVFKEQENAKAPHWVATFQFSFN